MIGTKAMRIAIMTAGSRPVMTPLMNPGTESMNFKKGTLAIK